MLKNSYKLLFLLTLMMGTLISISSSSWLSVWMGLEINLLSFIPLSMKSNNLFSSEASLKYFLTQAIASSTLLFIIIIFMFSELNLFTKKKMILNMCLASILMMKSGVAPFHFWFPNVMEGLSWINSFILMTWQKMAPLIILSFCLNFFLFNATIIISTFIGSMGGLNQTSLRKLLAFSSINHLGWMISNLINNENLWKIYFFFYSFLSLTIILTFKNFNIFNINQMFSLKFKTKMMKLFFSLPLLSLGGLPPFLGFFPKWITIETLIMNNFILMTFFMINFTLITLYFYIRICYSSFLLNHNILNWNFSWVFFSSKNSFWLNFLLFFTIFGLIFINLLFFILN
uniref:NADH dehydrogenase subunit 2 n=1 Tax=Tanytarsus formosanus TaxID=1636531 RepID=UPI0022DCDE8F|nr:NADH dehydrogenase subunit 2 [Tanytarsus formosanus]WAB46366.1 NADH dehydrogenase subunit 2 [Tanytarsus formosanus]